MTIGRNESCPCGSGKKFKHCHGQHTPAPPKYVAPLKYIAGQTPIWFRELVHDAICQAFDDPKLAIIGPHGQRCVRGELCDSVAMTTVWLLQHYGLAARVVFGSARWDRLPICFNWRGQAEYHAWVETEYEEFVDLACDSVRFRSDMADRVMPPSPNACWGHRTLITDRQYIEVAEGWKQISVDQPDSPSFLGVARRALEFAKTNEAKYREQFKEQEASAAQAGAQ
jgi:hypothetical protein